MKINPINSLNNYTNNINFKRTAVPYPEYINAYKPQLTFEEQVSNVINKIGSLFSPSVSKESENIKTGIDNLYVNKALEKETPKNQLLSVLG